MNFLFANSPPCLPKQSKKCPPFSVLAFALWNWSQWILLGLVLEGDEWASRRPRGQSIHLSSHSTPASLYFALAGYLSRVLSCEVGRQWVLVMVDPLCLPVVTAFPLLISLYLTTPCWFWLIVLSLGIFECPICFLSHSYGYNALLCESVAKVGEHLIFWDRA